MKKIVILLGLLIQTVLYSQTEDSHLLGASYVNFDNYATQQDFDWLIQATEEGDTLGYRHRLDKGSGTQRLIEMNNYLNDADRKLRVIVTASADITAEENLQHIETLIDAGVWVVAVELFNEPYSVVIPKLDWREYRKLFEPITSIVRQRYPDIFFLYFAAPRPSGEGINGGRSEHKIWNDSLARFIKKQPLQDGITWHIYFNEKDCNILDTIVPQVVYNPQILHEDLNQYYTTLFNQAYQSRLWDSTYFSLQKNFPGRRYAVTEFGIVYGAVDDGGAGDIKNTWVYSAIMFKTFVENRDRFYELDIHAGISPVGMISPRKEKYDLEEGVNLRRTEYWSYYLANKVPREVTEAKENNLLIFTEPGVYYSYFLNPSNELFQVNTLISGVQIKSISGEYIKGDHLYSSAGATNWMLKGSEKTYEIDTVRQLSSVDIPPISYGYIRFEIEEIPIYGCTDSLALNYDPNSNKELEPSSCYYYDQCKCKDELAVNADLSAPCENNSLCVYPEPECRRRFFRFCIKSKRNCNCSGVLKSSSIGIKNPNR